MKKTLSLIIVLSIVFSTLSFVAVNAEEEILIYDSFEDGLGSDWTVSELGKTNITVETSTAADGEKSLLINDDSTGTAAILYSKKVPALEGDEIKVSASFKHVDGANTGVYCKFFDESGKQLLSTSFYSNLTEWAENSKTVTAPVGTAQFQIWVTGTIKNLGKTYIDNIKAVRTKRLIVEVPEDGIVFFDDFENGLDKWEFYDEYAKSQHTVTDKTFYQGKSALYSIDDSESVSPIIKSPMIVGKPGDEFKISGAFKHEEGSNFKIWIKFFDANGKNQDNTGGSFGSSKTEWTVAEKTVYMPENCEKIQIWITSSNAVMGKTYIDDVKVKKKVEEIPDNPEEPENPVEPENPTVFPEGNIVFYDDFENGLSKWQFADAYAKSNHTITNKVYYQGTNALYSVDDSTEGSPVIKSQFIEGKPGDGFKIMGSFKHEENSNFKIWIKYYDANGKNQINGDSFGNNKTEWNVVEKLAYLPENCEKMQLWITSSSKAVGKTYIDNVFVIKLSDEEAEESRPVTLEKPVPIDGIPASSENFHIYLCIGQSNMVGADSIRNADIVRVENTYLYNPEGKWEVAQPYPTTGSEYMGFNRYSSVDASGKMGPTIGFARGMNLKAPEGVKIGIISNAISGTTVQEWSKGYGQEEDLPVMTDRPDRDLYEKAVNRTKEALAKGGVLKGIFYLQGESCAAKAGYMERLVKIADGLRQDIGYDIEDVPFFLSEIPQIRAAGVQVIRTAPQYISNCYVISSEGLTIFDSIHFDADSQRKLGLRFAETALSKVYGITASAEDMYAEIYGNIVENDDKKVGSHIVTTEKHLYISHLKQEDLVSGATIYAAVYSKENKLLEIKDLTESGQFDFDISDDTLKNAHHLKIFSWDVTMLLPLGDIIECEIVIM